MTSKERKALVRSCLGRTVTIQIDRPLGSAHPNHPDLIYPVNYGFIPGVLGGDGEELDVYLLGVDTPVNSYTARIIGIVSRRNDSEDKLVAAPEGVRLTAFEIEEAVRFQEQYFDSEIESLFERSSGTILFARKKRGIQFLLIRSRKSGICGFPKGHIERGETEAEAALRETWEETSVRANLVDGFRRVISYQISGGKTKSVVFFLADCSGQTPKHNPGFEHFAYLLLPYEKAYEALTHDNTKMLLKEANDFLLQR